jgi:hypothetical protein
MLKSSAKARQTACEHEKPFVKFAVASSARVRVMRTVLCTAEKEVMVTTGKVQSTSIGIHGFFH